MWYASLVQLDQLFFSNSFHSYTLRSFSLAFCLCLYIAWCVRLLTVCLLSVFHLALLGPRCCCLPRSLALSFSHLSHSSIHTITASTGADSISTVYIIWLARLKIERLFAVVELSFSPFICMYCVCYWYTEMCRRVHTSFWCYLLAIVMEYALCRLFLFFGVFSSCPFLLECCHWNASQPAFFSHWHE